MSVKMGMPVEWESQIERDFLYHLEFDDDVQAYQAQPILFRYTFNHNYHRHYPDFEIFRYSTPRRKFVEIKPTKVSEQEEFQEKTAAIKAQMQKEGFDYGVVTDEQIRVEPKLSNLKLLYRYLPHEYDDENVEQLINHLKINKQQTLTFGDLNQIAEQYSLKLIDCYSCIANKIFNFDTKRPLSLTTVLSLTGNQKL